MQADSEPAFVLHTRPYRETSQLVDLFSRHYGRSRVVARGFRRPKTSATVLSPFTPLLVSWKGKNELKTLVSAEQSGTPLMLSGDRLFSGFYLNELLLRLLVDNDPHTSLFDHYLETISGLSDAKDIEVILRRFEFCLLEKVGYAPVMNIDAVTGDEVIAECWYWYDPMVGVSARVRANHTQTAHNWFRGDELLAMYTGDEQHPDIARSKKRMMRLAIQSLLGGKPLRSRELFSGAKITSNENK